MNYWTSQGSEKWLIPINLRLLDPFSLSRFYWSNFYNWQGGWHTSSRLTNRQTGRLAGRYTASRLTDRSTGNQDAGKLLDQKQNCFLCMYNSKFIYFIENNLSFWILLYCIYLIFDMSRGPSILTTAAHPSLAVMCFVPFVHPFHTSFPFRLSNISDQQLGFSLSFLSAIRTFRDYSKPCRREMSALALATLCYFRTIITLFQFSSWTSGGFVLF